MNAPLHPTAVKQAAIADYYSSTDTAQAVAARHGIPRSTFSAWVAHADRNELAYEGGWEVRGGVRYPLFPEHRGTA